jgi:ankyrin repeat protein
MVNHLLENTKVEINRKNKKHQTALSLALVYQNNKVVEILTKHGAKI